MYCPSDVNTGFIELVGPILQQDLNSITVRSYPLSISFAPRTTPPTLIGNRIDESTENTCTFKGKRFSLVDVQICSVTNKGYTLPGQTDKPVAELIISFSANNQPLELADLSGILLCVPIYDTGAPTHGAYLNQLISTDVPQCDYTTISGADYTGGDYQQIPNTTLSGCIKAACADPNCLAFTYYNGTCYMKNSIPPIRKGLDPSFITGTVNHNVLNPNATCPVPNCPIPKCNGQHGGNQLNDATESKVPNLQRIFYAWPTDTSQHSLAYKTCFETMDANNNPTSRSLYVVVFPNGIHLTPTAFQTLLLQLNTNLPSYQVPPAIRGGDSTLRSFTFDDDGNKVPNIISQDGITYSTPISSCTDEFRHRFEYFTQPPRLPASVSAKFNTEKCPYYKTTEYKCVPFNQLKDLSGAYVIPGNKTLDTILYEQDKAKQEEEAGNAGSPSAISADTIETIIAAIAGGGIALLIAIYVGSKISKYA